MAEQGQIVIPVEVMLQGDLGGAAQGVSQGGGQDMPMAERINGGASNARMMIAGVSAQLLMGGVSKLLSTTGNQQASAVLREGSAYGFLALRAISGDPSAIVSLLVKGTADIIQLVQEQKEELRKSAEAYNQLDLNKMRAGMIQFTANSVVSIDKYGRRTIKERR